MTSSDPEATLRSDIEVLAICETETLEALVQIRMGGELRLLTEAGARRLAARLLWAIQAGEDIAVGLSGSLRAADAAARARP
jgi:hypothetical protein